MEDGGLLAYHDSVSRDSRTSPAMRSENDLVCFRHSSIVFDNDNFNGIKTPVKRGTIIHTSNNQQASSFRLVESRDNVVSIDEASQFIPLRLIKPLPSHAIDTIYHSRRHHGQEEQGQGKEHRNRRRVCPLLRRQHTRKLATSCSRHWHQQ